MIKTHTGFSPIMSKMPSGDSSVWQLHLHETSQYAETNSKQHLRLHLSNHARDVLQPQVGLVAPDWLSIHSS